VSRSQKAQKMHLSIARVIIMSYLCGLFMRQCPAEAACNSAGKGKEDKGNKFPERRIQGGRTNKTKKANKII